MNRWILNSIGISIVAALSLTVWGGFGLCRHSIAVLDAWGSASPAATLNKLNATLDAVNAPCIGFHGSVTCGPIAQLSQTEKNVGIVAGLSAQQVKQSGVLINAAAQSIQDTSEHLNRTADALTETAQGATTALGTANESIAASKPLLVNLTATSAALTARISNPEIDRIIGHFDSTSGHLDAMSGDLQKVADKETADFLKPVPWWMYPVKKGGEFIDIGAAVARHVP